MKLALVSGDGTVLGTFEGIEDYDLTKSFGHFDVLDWLKTTLESESADPNRTRGDKGIEEDEAA